MSIALASFLAIASLLAISVANAVAAPPTVVTEGPPVVTKLFGTTYKAELKGTVNPNGIATTYFFEWGLTTGYGSNTSTVSAGSGSSPVSASATIFSLPEGSVYHYRLVGKNADGTSYGADKVFVVETVPTWSLQTTPNPSTFANELKDVSCLPGGECFAVGNTEGAGTGFTTAQRWNGTEWKTQTTPWLGGVGHSLEGISCTSTTACTAVGYQTVAGGKKALVERWDGTAWKTQEVPGASGALRAVSCVSATECMAVNYGSSYTRWNGKEWSALTSVFGEGEMRDVSCTSASFCMAVGVVSSESKAKSFVWNGSTWKSQKTLTGWFWGVSCSATNVCTAVGMKQEGIGTLVSLAARWSGSEWVVQATPNPAGAPAAAFSGVSCPSATVCFATGESAGGTLAERWNGVSWEIQSTPNPAGATQSWFQGVSCISTVICESVGGSRDSESKTKTLAERAS